MTKQNPLLLGFKSFSNELDKKAEFGNVIVTIKKGDKIVDNDINIISISRLARESNTTEAEAMSSMQKQGYSLISPEDFWEVWDYERESIFKGES